jgi:hypothetical protein
VWWLLGLLVAGAVVAVVVVAVRGRRARKAWDARAAGAVAESRWLAHELLPNALSAQNAAARRDIWTAFRPRVDALQRTLSGLVASAPKDRSGSLDRLRAAVRDLASALDAHTAPDAAPGSPVVPESLGAARQAQRQLEEALRAMQPRP